MVEVVVVVVVVVIGNVVVVEVVVVVVRIGISQHTPVNVEGQIHPQF